MRLILFYFFCFVSSLGKYLLLNKKSVKFFRIFDNFVNLNIKSMFAYTENRTKIIAKLFRCFYDFYEATRNMTYGTHTG